MIQLVFNAHWVYFYIDLSHLHYIVLPIIRTQATIGHQPSAWRSPS